MDNVVIDINVYVNWELIVSKFTVPGEICSKEKSYLY